MQAELHTFNLLTCLATNCYQLLPSSHKLNSLRLFMPYLASIDICFFHCNQHHGQNEQQQKTICSTEHRHSQQSRAALAQKINSNEADGSGVEEGTTAHAPNPIPAIPIKSSLSNGLTISEFVACAYKQFRDEMLQNERIKKQKKTEHLQSNPTVKMLESLEHEKNVSLYLLKKHGYIKNDKAEDIIDAEVMLSDEQLILEGLKKLCLELATLKKDVYKSVLRN
ncbi:hypothetical protein HELRODRAFT_188254 [Helobdella robusta]|uniref:Uncharacterized protein n=1 Tax=Helobdella robusta TaxID=6412 RepID=T1FPT2_HELRO|nr:hypothetical protein HELRODRAFT_188254 [Helobdella robusta]ESO06083.1 hypothetical protein HELRODRAFT_188254 [Helobdella robusta]